MDLLEHVRPTDFEEPDFTAERAKRQFARARECAGKGEYPDSIFAFRTALRREQTPRVVAKVRGLELLWRLIIIHADDALSLCLHAHLVTFNALAVREIKRWDGRKPLSETIETSFQRRLKRVMLGQRMLGALQTRIEWLCDPNVDRIDEAQLTIIQDKLKYAR